MTDLHTAAKLALEALECKDGWGSSVFVLKERAVTSLRTALSASKIEGDLMQRLYEGEEAKSLISEAEDTITALRRALEQPAPVAEPRKQEPYGYLKLNTGRFAHEVEGCPDPAKEGYLPLYTLPQAREPLTKEEIGKVLDAAGVTELPNGYGPVELEIVRATEAAHGITREKK